MITVKPVFAESEFRKSSRSIPDKECVQVARRDDAVAVRDTKTPFGTPADQHLIFTADQFDDFLKFVG
jgi:hypothetical protein